MRSVIAAAGGAVGCRIRDPDSLCASAHDHAPRCCLLAGASARQGGSCPRRRDNRALIQINTASISKNVMTTADSPRRDPARYRDRCHAGEISPVTSDLVSDLSGVLPCLGVQDPRVIRVHSL
jgi:hypothetical protein